MKKTRILLALLIALTMVFTVALVACNPDDEDGPNGPTGGSLEYADGTVLRIAAGYNNAKTGITFNSDVAGEGVQLLNGKTYYEGDLKPTWQQISDDMKITFENKYQGNSAANEYKYWKDQLNQVDILAGTATLLQEGGAQGNFVNLADYLDVMPNFAAYLEANPIVRLSITGSTTGANAGAIFFSPYFDGVDDIERYPLVRADFVKTLLDGDTAYTGANRDVTVGIYQPYTKTEGTISVGSLNADGSATQTIVKDYSKAQNIIAQMNAASNLKGDAAVAMFRKYIDDMYGNTYAKRSDLFLGYNAAWDADELVALMRCAVASLYDVDGNPITGLFSRESSNMQREVDLFRFAGSLFGVRGMESRSDYLWFDSEGNLRDARQEADAYAAVERLNWMKQEGLVASDDDTTSADRLAKDAGIVSYDYCQTQTIYNATKLNENGNRKTDTGEEYTVMMVPVALWYDGTNLNAQGVDQGVWMRFTESWRSVKTDGWGISKAGIGNDQNKLNAALALIDFAFSIQGQITMSYGSDDFIQVKDASVVINDWDDVAKKYYTFNFNGQEWPLIKDGMLDDLFDKANGSYTDYARFYLGSTLNGFPKSQAFENQCTHEIGQIGAAKVSAAIARGTIKHPLLSINEDNMWYTSIPTTFPHSDRENTQLNSLSNLAGDAGLFGQSKDTKNIFIFIVRNGWNVEDFGATTINTPADAAELVAGAWGGNTYISQKQIAWGRLYQYYLKNS